jgi:rsbT co-antagonist protein RsbR
MRADLIKESDLREQSRRFLQLLTEVVQQNGDDENAGSWRSVKDMLAEVSRSRVAQGFSPSETATFVFSLKQPMFDMLRREVRDVEELGREIWMTTSLLDKLGLYTTEAYLQLWDNIVALPLIGTLDSERTQVVMENLLEKVVETGASIAIIDITGVPTVDTLVAQHLLKTVAAARLMGADCIISGIRPQIAQTIVHLGINLADIITKATLADAFAIALQRTGAKVTRLSGKE